MSRVIANKLRLDAEIGRGAMGVVWRAHDLSLDRAVAVKVLSAREASGSTEGRNRFEREAKAVAGLDSPHIVQVFDFGVDGDAPFFVMELLDGEDLGERIDREATGLPLAFAVEVVAQVCRGLSVAHAKGVVHRDLKPANLFLVANASAVPRVKILDFGVAKQLDPPEKGMTMTQTGTLVGTPFYMSPEQILAPRDIDERTDLWSLAVVAYVMLTGTVPFDGETIGALSIAIHQGTFPRPTEVRPELPLALDAWFERAFRQMPDERFESAAELDETFAAACRNEGASRMAVTQDPADGAEERAALTERLPLRAQRARRRRRWALTAGLVVASGVGSAMVAGQFAPSAPDPVAEPAPTEANVPPAPPAPTPTQILPSVVETSTATASNDPPAPAPTTLKPPSTPRWRPPPPMKKRLGLSCVDDAECRSEHCSDGVCCDFECSGRCKTCVAGYPGPNGSRRPRGYCGYAKKGTNPRGECMGRSLCNGYAICYIPPRVTSP
ncbi:MAG: serine/threonine-protein kinase [Myxococcota bacterium]